MSLTHYSNNVNRMESPTLYSVIRYDAEQTKASCIDFSKYKNIILLK